MSRVKKQIEFEDVQPVPLNLIHGQYTSRRHKIDKGIISQPAMKTYYELREIQTDDGYVEKLVEVDYPITPDYVKSFANSSDYRNDIERAMNEPARGVNMGDMTNLQDIVNMDMTAVKDLQAKLAERAKQLQATQETAQNTTQETAQNIESGVTNNG